MTTNLLLVSSFFIVTIYLSHLNVFLFFFFSTKVLNQCWGWTEEILILHESHRLSEGEEEDGRKEGRKDGQNSQHTCFIYRGEGEEL